MIALSLHHVSRTFAQNPRPAVDDLSLDLPAGQILALVGPSGCGKTTTLRLIAGLECPDRGKIFINGRLMASSLVFVPPERRGVGMVFQDHALFPHLTVFDNVAFGLRGKPRTQVRQTVHAMLEMVGLQALAGRYPHALSGGERQRVALARALAPRPVLVLMDEPFSSLDADMRLEMREQVRGILKEMGATVVFVTHDQEEALFMGDRLAVFREGRMEQLGTPEEIFHASTSRFVAEFMGDSDFLPGSVVHEGIHTPLGVIAQPLSLPAGTPVEIALRADDVDFVPDGQNGNAVIVERFFRGAFHVYRLRLESGEVLHAFKEHTLVLPAGMRVRARISAEHPLIVFPKRA
ncbi:ABC transporter ATP-binding protein [Anaerolinea thermophila]|uniref:ABC-type quaternary amine transporter n=2 Tax=Anaerolinea TaxID=233189 RepID=E8N248_ANATU|nr:ABC transporter ATP-binding protein [Anaerolinea thermophila]BAJ64995.1 ABC transporter ATP-binding protein [Anaerolinea thermophila UNI-1]